MNLPGWLLSVPCFQRLIIRFKDDPRLPGTKFLFGKCGRSKSTMSTAAPTQRPSGDFVDCQFSSVRSHCKPKIRNERVEREISACRTPYLARKRRHDLF